MTTTGKTDQQQRDEARAAAARRHDLAVFDCYAALRGATFTREGALAKLKALGVRRDDATAAASRYEGSRTPAKSETPAAGAPEVCTKCGTHVAYTEDWTLWPWPDGARLCGKCNDERHEREEYP